MAKNDFKAFATDRNANVISQEEWEALPALLSGFTAGKASSAQVNKVIRQASFIAAALAQFVSDKTQRDVLDNGDLPGFVELLGSGFAVEYLSRKNPFGDIKSDGTVKTALENLGLAYFADKKSSNEQMFNGVVASKKGVSSVSSDGRRKVNLFVSETGYEIIVYIDGVYNNSIQIPTKYGTMALLDDVSNSVKSAPPPIGIPFLWPLSAMPNTVVPEWASNVFLKMNGATFSASTYPALARVWPGLKLTDCRGEFLRIWDDGRGVDSGRALLSAQGDAMRNFTGNAGFFTDGLFTYASGAFKLGPSATNKLTASEGSGANAYVTLDPSTVVPTAAENRPRNVAFNLLVRAK
ncbi:tail fiber protein [Escherichia coli]|nr:tail fiber protein [Escherichia coli]